MARRRRCASRGAPPLLAVALRISRRRSQLRAAQVSSVSVDPRAAGQSTAGARKVSADSSCCRLPGWTPVTPCTTADLRPLSFAPCCTHGRCEPWTARSLGELGQLPARLGRASFAGSGLGRKPAWSGTCTVPGPRPLNAASDFSETRFLPCARSDLFSPDVNSFLADSCSPFLPQVFSPPKQLGTCSENLRQGETVPPPVPTSPREAPSAPNLFSVSLSCRVSFDLPQATATILEAEDPPRRAVRCSIRAGNPAVA